MATPLRGSVPNTRWPVATLTWEELRSSSSSASIVPLPPRHPVQPETSSPPQKQQQQQQTVDPARVRQDDSPLTKLLHRGVLTGGYINALVGLADGGAGAARVGAPRGARGGGNGSSSSSRGRRRRAPAPARLDPHAAAILHLRQPRWDFAKEGLSSPALLAEEEEAAGRAKQRRKRTPEEVARGGIVPVRMAWGNAAEAAALRSLASALSAKRKDGKGRQHGELFRCCGERGGGGGGGAGAGARPASSSGSASASASASASVTLEEVGMLMVSQEALEGLLGSSGSDSGSGSSLPLPPLAASPDALARHRSSGGNGKGEGEEGEEGEGEGERGLSWLEPVEVKCVCPFRLVGRNSARRSGGRAFDDGEKGRGDGGGNPFARFELGDPGPRPLPPASAMPQLQLQMLACGSPSALLVSHSATRGGRVWRVARDDAFLRKMLLVASKAFERHVVGGEPPPARGGEGSSGPQQQHAAGLDAVLRLADACVAIAASAKEVALLPPPGGVDPTRAFLQ